MQRKDMLPVVGRGRVGTSSIGVRNGKLVDGSCVTSVGKNEIGILDSVRTTDRLVLGLGGRNKSHLHLACLVQYRHHVLPV
jgi:hypothetical protein